MISNDGFSVVAPISRMVPLLDIGQKGVLLRFVEAMDLVHEEDGARAVLSRTLFRVRHHLFDFLDPARAQQRTR